MILCAHAFPADLAYLRPRVRAYTVFYTDPAMREPPLLEEFLAEKMAEFLPYSELPSFLEEAPEIYHARDYGAILPLGAAVPANGSDTLSVTVRGNDAITYQGVFGQEPVPILTHLYNITLQKDTEVEPERPSVPFLSFSHAASDKKKAAALPVTVQPPLKT